MVISYRVTQYDIECDECKASECCPDSNAENVHSKAAAIKWAGMHRVKDGRVLCDECFFKYKISAANYKRAQGHARGLDKYHSGVKE